MKDKLTTALLLIAAAASLATSESRTPQLERFAELEAVNIAEDDWEPIVFQVHVRVPQHGLSADQFDEAGLTFEARLEPGSTGAALAKMITAPGDVERGVFTRIDPAAGRVESSMIRPYELSCADGICAFDAAVSFQRATAGTILIGGTVKARVAWDDVSPETDTPLTHELEITVER